MKHCLEHTRGDKVEETVKFVRMIDKFFDCLNVNSFTEGKHNRKPFQEPYRSKDDFRIKIHMLLYDITHFKINVFSVAKGGVSAILTRLRR